MLKPPASMAPVLRPRRAAPEKRRANSCRYSPPRAAVRARSRGRPSSAEARIPLEKRQLPPANQEKGSGSAVPPSF